MSNANTTADYLNQLKKDKKQLVDKLIEKEIEASYDETFTELVPKVVQEMGESGLNVYAQKDEPSKKDGIWINTSAYSKKSDTYAPISNIPYNNYNSSAITMDNYIYLFGGTDSEQTAYKYNTKTSVYTQLTNIPFSYTGSAVEVGPNIYLFGNSDVYAYSLLYEDTVPDPYVPMESIPGGYGFSSRHGVTALGSDIYIFGVKSSSSSSTYTYAYMYDTIREEYTQLSNIPISFQGAVVAFNNCIYMFPEASSKSNYVYKYDPRTDTYSQLTTVTLPYTYFNSTAAVLVNQNIYLFGTNSSNTAGQYVYKYQPEQGFEQLSNVPNAFYGSIAAIGNDSIYLFGFVSPYLNNVYKYQINISLPVINKAKVDGVEVIKTDIESIDTYIRLSDAPHNFYSGAAVKINNDVYFFGGQNTRYTYKYNISTNSYIKLTDIPYYFYKGSVAAIGTDIYLFGGQVYSSSSSYTYAQYAYKYNTITNTYTQVTNIPYYFYGGSAVGIGLNAFLFGSACYFSGSYQYSHYTYKYNTVTDTYTKVTNIPFEFCNGAISNINTDVYLLGGGGDTASHQNAYKYNTLTDTYTVLKNIPFSFRNGSASALNTTFYLFGGNISGSLNKAYEYNILTNTYKQLSDIPYDWAHGITISINNSIYLFGDGYSSDTYKYVYKYKAKKIEPKYINNYIFFKNTTYLYKILLSKIFTLYLDNAYIYLDNEIKEYPAYYGDGEKWNLIEE